MHRKNFDPHASQDQYLVHDLTISDDMASASAITGMPSSDKTPSTENTSDSMNRISDNGLIPRFVAHRLVHNVSILRSAKAKSEGVIDPKFA